MKSLIKHELIRNIYLPTHKNFSSSPFQEAGIIEDSKIFLCMSQNKLMILNGRYNLISVWLKQTAFTHIFPLKLLPSETNLGNFNDRLVNWL